MNHGLVYVKAPLDETTGERGVRPSIVSSIEVALKIKPGFLTRLAGSE